MNGMEIVLLLLGIGAFAASFFVPEKKSEEAQIDDELIHSLINKELADTKTRVSEVVDETLDYAVEKTERAAERISNEKIMAISEYSDTVMADMNKTHQEIMFLYDMLNDKHKNLKETAIKVDKTAKAAEEKVQAVASAIEPAAPKSNVVPMTTPEPVAPKSAVPKPQPEFHIIEPPKPVKPTPITEAVKQAPKKEQPAASKTEKEQPKIKEFSFAEQAPHIERAVVQEMQAAQAAQLENKVAIMRAPQPEEPTQESAKDTAAAENNNDRILRLHKEGKDTVDIAKELGLGVGEVKLVINLFKGA